MKVRWVETAVWNGVWGDGDVIVAEDFGLDDRRC